MNTLISYNNSNSTYTSMTNEYLLNLQPFSHSGSLGVTDSDKKTISYLLSPVLLQKWEDIKTRLSVRHKFFLYWLIFSEVFGMHGPCDTPFQLAPCRDLHLLQGHICCHAGEHNFPNFKGEIFNLWPCEKHLLYKSIKRKQRIILKVPCIKYHPKPEPQTIWNGQNYCICK